MSDYKGDFAEDAVVTFFFNTVDTDGAPITLAGTPAVEVYKDGGLTQSTAGVTLTVDFDGVTGKHKVVVDMSADAFYAVNSDYEASLSAGTADSVSVIGASLAEWSCENRFDEVSATNTVAANVTQISGDATAADNLEAYCDGTTPIPANATQISGDATAADNLESYCDGTTPIPTNATQVNGSAITTKYLVRKPLVARSDDGLTDLWVIPWITDAGTPTNALTNGTLTVFKASDGSSFIAGGSCTTVGTHRMRRSVTSTLIEPDEIYLITASATIDSSTRSYTTEMSGAELLSDVARISGDGTAANNLESYCDGTTPIPANATQISGSATAADVLELLHASAITTGTVGAGTFSTTLFQTDLAEADDFHNKAIIVFTSGSLAGQARVISDFANTNGAVTVSEAFSSAPVTGATFIVIGRSQ